MSGLVGEFGGGSQGIIKGLRIVALHARERKRTRIVLWSLAAGLIAGGLLAEARTSWLQAKLLTAAARRIKFSVQAGADPQIRFPHSGPYDRRLGYAGLSGYIGRLQKSGFEVTAQARSSAFSNNLYDVTRFSIYPEKWSAGFDLLDHKGESLYRRRYPERTYSDFESIPPVIVRSLLFVENRELLDPNAARRNPVLEWERLAKAVRDVATHVLRPSTPVAGGSTLATQIEKVRHSPEGRTSSIVEKGRQMAAASLRAYTDGEETITARRRIVRDYLNSLPLASRPGYGEVSGIGDGLWLWFGSDFNDVNRLLWQVDAETAPAGQLSEQARVYRQALTLLLATKKPSVYLNGDPTRLTERVESFLRLLAQSGLISAELREAALAAPLVIVEAPPASAAVDFAVRKGSDSIRVELLNQLGVASLYDLDRLDMTVGTTLDNTSADVANVLRRLSDPSYAAGAGVIGEHLLRPVNLSSVVYSFTLYERTPAGNALRVQVDNFDGPLNINQGTMLELGSTAKLRTLVTYLEVLAELHREYSASGGRVMEATDNLSRWAAKYLASATDKGLPAMLEAAMNRMYSANPWEQFFTGGSPHVFANFDSNDDGRILTVREAFQRSVNLVFIRLMRDLVDYSMARMPGVSPGLLGEKDDPIRPRYLNRFADEEGRIFLRRIYTKYLALTTKTALEEWISRKKPAARELAAIFRSVRPEASLDEFTKYLTAFASTDKASELYVKFEPGKFNLNDRANLAHMHPLELWLLAYLDKHPHAKYKDVEAACIQERQDVYTWLLQPKGKHGQDIRIRALLEADAFKAIHQRWHRLGYPFPSLVPSLATAIGSSGDTPAALSELAGIVQNHGVRHPVTKLRQIRFAESTPFETVLTPHQRNGVTVLEEAVASKVKQEMIGVVAKGTGGRASRSVVLRGGQIIAVGGKTGTGDNRLHVYAPGGAEIGSKVVNRTAAFVFLIGDRFFGTVVTYVPGEQAARYSFTSALPVQVFRHLAPKLRPLFEEELRAAK